VPKKIICLTMLLFWLLGSLCFASDGNITDPHIWTRVGDTPWYYDGFFLSINFKGELDGYFKLDGDNDDVYVSHSLISRNVRKSKVLKLEHYGPDGYEDLTYNVGGEDIAPGTDFEQCAQTAMAYAKERHLYRK